MSLFSDLFGDSLETQVIKEINTYLTSIHQKIARENAALRSIGIEPPRLISELSCKHKVEGKNQIRVTLAAPQFDLPPHLIFVIKREQQVVTFFNDTENIERHCWWWGLASVLYEESYGGIWTNRDPFAVYRWLQKKYPYESLLCEKPGDFTAKAKIKSDDYFQNQYEQSQAEKIPSLQAANAVSYEEATHIHLRAQLYDYVTWGARRELADPGTYYSMGVEGASSIPANILFNLPVAETSVETDPSRADSYSYGSLDDERNAASGTHSK